MLFNLHIWAMSELAIDEPLNSSELRGKVCRVAKTIGLDLDSAIWSKPKSDLYVDCSLEQIQDVIDATWRLQYPPEPEFWDDIWDFAELDLNGAPDTSPY